MILLKGKRVVIRRVERRDSESYECTGIVESFWGRMVTVSLCEGVSLTVPQERIVRKRGEE